MSDPLAGYDARRGQNDNDYHAWIYDTLRPPVNAFEGCRWPIDRYEDQ